MGNHNCSKIDKKNVCKNRNSEILKFGNEFPIDIKNDKFINKMMQIFLTTNLQISMCS